MLPRSLPASALGAAPDRAGPIRRAIRRRRFRFCSATARSKRAWRSSGVFCRIVLENIDGLGVFVLAEQGFGQAELGGRGVGLQGKRLAICGFGRRGLAVGEQRASERDQHGVVLGGERDCGAILRDGFRAFPARARAPPRRGKRDGPGQEELRRRLEDAAAAAGSESRSSRPRFK